MAKLVDDAIGRLPENIQRELNDAWASGKSSPYTRVVDPLNATLLHRAQTIRGMQMEIAALKAQRDELLVALGAFRSAINKLQLAGQDGVNVHGALSGFIGARDMADALIAKHKEASHG